MISSLLLGLGQIAVVTAVGFGIAYPLSQTSSTTKNQVLDTKPLEPIHQETGPIESKKCEIFLTSVNGIYTVISCLDSNNTKNWYLFSSKDSSLIQIKGLTSSNSPRSKLGPSINDWKEKEWKGVTGWEERSQKGRFPINTPFKIAYKDGSSGFPFFQYLKSACDASLNTVIRPEDPIEFTCNSFDVPVSRFTVNLQIPEFKKTFNSNGEPKCFQGRNNKWMVTTCETIKSSK